MDVDVKNLEPPSEEELRWAERMTESDEDFPGQSGIVAHRMRLRRDAAARQRRFEEAREKLRKVSLPRAA